MLPEKLPRGVRAELPNSGIIGTRQVVKKKKSLISSKGTEDMEA